MAKQKRPETKPSKKIDRTWIFFWAFILKNSLYIFVHNRLNAFLYLFLAGAYGVLYGRSALKSRAGWSAVLLAPHLLTLYYLDFGLILVSLAIDLVLIGGFFYLKKRS